VVLRYFAVCVVLVFSGFWRFVYFVIFLWSGLGIYGNFNVWVDII